MTGTALDTWGAALAAARKRWATATASERKELTADLDALYAELGFAVARSEQSSGQTPGQSSGQSSPRHAAVNALLTSERGTRRE